MLLFYPIRTVIEVVSDNDNLGYLCFYVRSISVYSDDKSLPVDYVTSETLRFDGRRPTDSYPESCYCRYRW